MARFVIPKEQAALDQQTPAVNGEVLPPEQPRFRVRQPDDPSRLQSFLRGAYQGLTFEFGDELASLFPGGGDTYDERLQRFRDLNQRAADANPWMYGAGKFTGAVGSTAVPGGAALRAGATIPRMVGAGAAVGAGTGAVEGFGAGEGGLGNRLEGAGIGGAVGGVVGGAAAPALYALGSGVRAGGRYLYDMATGNRMAPALRKTEQALRRQGSDPGVLAEELRAGATPMVRNAPPEQLAEVLRLTQQGRTATEVASEVNQRFGTNLTAQQVGQMTARFGRANPTPRDLLALSEEVGGGPAGRSGLTSLMQGVATLPGRGREIAMSNMGRTMQDAPERMAGRMRGVLGSDDFMANRAARVQQRQQEADRMYGAARQAERPFDIQGVLDSYALYAGRIGGETGARINQAVAMASGLQPGSTRLGVDTIDRFLAARRSLDELITDLRRGANPDRNALRIIGQLRNDLNQAVYAANPALRAADQRFASNIAREHAMDIGRSFDLKSGAKYDEVVQEFEDLLKRHPGNEDELRDMFAEGLMRRIADEIENRGGVPPQWLQPMTGEVKPAVRRALERVLRPDEAKAILGIMRDESRLRRIFADVWGNSNTANKLAAQEDLRELPRIASEMATGGISGLRNAVVNRLVRALTERNAEDIARIVTETDPRVLFVALQDIRRMRPGLIRSEQIMGVPSIAVGGASGQALTDR